MSLLLLSSLLIGELTVGQLVSLLICLLFRVCYPDCPSGYRRSIFLLCISHRGSHWKHMSCLCILLLGWLSLVGSTTHCFLLRCLPRARRFWNFSIFDFIFRHSSFSLLYALSWALGWTRQVVVISVVWTFRQVGAKVSFRGSWRLDRCHYTVQ